jgi:hypothetical protein
MPSLVSFLSTWMTAFEPSFGIKDHQLKDSFPELFCIARNTDALVADHMFTHNGEMHWDMNSIRLVHDWEVEFVSSFFNTLYYVMSQ